MTERATPQISSRKRPRQSRSNALVAVILEAAAQVLAQQGAARFTTARVAERAGVSIGSLYQYFPNKAAILFRLQTEEWAQTGDVLRRVLEDAATPPLQRLRLLVHAFLRSECEEAQMRVALSDAAPLYRDAPETRQARAQGEAAFEAFMREALPKATPETRALAVDLIGTTLSTVGKQFSSSGPSAAAIDAYAEAMADMFCAYLQALMQAGATDVRAATPTRSR
jgi:AcrR family transcriptional regulator